MDKLQEYRRKRNFERTAEPVGALQANEVPGNLYVLHKHAASHDHFDLRLEQDGVLRSWALPKGPSLAPGEKRLAIEVEDHPLEYGNFEGIIPKQSYGGGTVMLWDRGSWTPKGKRNHDHIDFELKGERLQGAWTLTRMQGGKQKQDKHGKSWLLIKRSDDRRNNRAKAQCPAVSVDDDRSIISGRSMQQIAENHDDVQPSRSRTPHRTITPPATLAGARKAPLPRSPRPQLASLASQVPEHADWVHEIKLDGYRILARIENGNVTLLTRNGKDWTHRFPELARQLQTPPIESALIDGEIVAMAQDGTSSFRRLQELLSSRRTTTLIYQLFDLIHIDGYDLKQVPLTQRKQVLAEFHEAAGFTHGSNIRYSDHIDSQGVAFFEQACQLGLEGIISKRASSTYQQRRSKDWLKVKCAVHEEFVIGGFTEPGGSRRGFGSLLIGIFDSAGRLDYAGRVGTGFNNRLLETLSDTLQRQVVPLSPFNDPIPDIRKVHWVHPSLVIEVEYTERTRDGRLRHPTFRGLREDREPEEIRMTATKEKAKISRPRADKEETQLLGVRLTTPDRILFPEQGLTKLDLARFYDAIQEWVLPQLVRRPLSLVRCPQGRDDECFFQKHPRAAIPDSVPRLDIAEKRGHAEYLYIETAADLVALVQAGALEIHPWGSRIDALEHPDCLVFDLDPGPGVPWKAVLHIANTLRERLLSLGLESFVRTTGGKGLHLVVPLEPKADWDQAKAFAKAIAQHHANDDPKRLTANVSKTKRQGRIFIDYLRNGRGATAVASYTVRARKGAPVAVPVRWDELNAALRADRYTVENLRRRLAALRRDPWEDYTTAARPLDARLLKVVGVS